MKFHDDRRNEYKSYKTLYSHIWKHIINCKDNERTLSRKNATTFS